ncbi:hypothetical protein C8R46DRAFT_1059714 [Mycena filopes]|nr:hypothetical protein C8R46DRAFT_1059714 [Mycena filopes]
MTRGTPSSQNPVPLLPSYIPLRSSPRRLPKLPIAESRIDFHPSIQRYPTPPKRRTKARPKKAIEMRDGRSASEDRTPNRRRGRRRRQLYHPTFPTHIPKTPSTPLRPSSVSSASSSSPCWSTPQRFPLPLPSTRSRSRCCVYPQPPITAIKSLRAPRSPCPSPDTVAARPVGRN